MQLFRLCIVIPVLLGAPIATAADADNGKRLAETRCAPSMRAWTGGVPARAGSSLRAADSVSPA